MKQLRLYLILLLGWIMAACSTDTQVEIPEPEPERPALHRHAVPVEQALDELGDLLALIDGEGTRAGGVRSVEAVETLHADRLPQTRSTELPEEEQPEDLLYVVNFEGGQGYAVLGADDRLPGVLAIADEGALTTDDLVRAASGQTPPGEFSFPNEMMMDYVSAIGGIGGGGTGGGGIGGIGGGGIGGGGGIPKGPITDVTGHLGPDDLSFVGNTVDEWKTIDHVPAMVKTKWGQGAPYNAYCPTINDKKCLTGCVSVAAAQLLCANKYRSGIGPEKIGSYRSIGR